MGGQGVNVITQLLIPPIFLRHYNIAAYGEWLTLTATVSYLGTLNFGLQTFANNQVAISYNRGDVEEAKTLQATAFSILLGIIGLAAIFTALVFLVPINHWLGLKTSHAVVAASIYLLGLQILTKMIFGFLGGTFLVIGVSYRGTNWNNAQALVSMLGTAVLAFLHTSFAWIAAQQLINVAVFCILILFDLRMKAPDVFPRIRYADPKRIGAILKPSGYFGMLFCSNFLVYQLPVILMQRILGSTSVVVFSLTRTIYSMSRQALTAMTNAIGPEITELYGQRNWTRLFRLYELSERVIFALIPVVTIGTLLITPVLMAVWLHRPALYDPWVCIVMGLISGVMGIKEHKYTFQTSSNEHAMLARLTLWSYVVMVIVALPAIHLFGVLGFLVVWFVTEIIQVLAILRLNLRLFAGQATVDFSPVYKLFALMSAAIVLQSWFAFRASQRSLLQICLTALVFVIVLAAISYPLFGLGEVRRHLGSRFGWAQPKTL